MVRFLIGFLVCACAIQPVSGQRSDTWIDPAQTYYKIKVGRDGLYRLTYEELSSAGLFPGPAANLAVFHRGVEQAVSVSAGEDGIFNAGDFIEFYGKRNDGVPDAALYTNAADQPHQYYNLYSDTTAYFVTAGSAPGRRMQVLEESGDNASTAEYVYAERLQLFTERYSGGENVAGEFYSSTFDAGEGWISNPIAQGQAREVAIAGITNGVATGPKPALEILLVGGRVNFHSVDVFAGPALRALGTAAFQGFASHAFSVPLEWSDISADGTLRLQIRLNGTIQDRVSIGYVKVTYPRDTDLGSAAYAAFALHGAGENIKVNFRNPSPGSRLFEVTPGRDVREIAINAATGVAVIPGGTDAHRRFAVLASAAGPGAVRKARFRAVDPSRAGFVIIAHPVLRAPAAGYGDPVREYGAYRASPAGGGFDTLTIDVDVLYDQYNYGERSPLAIYRFLKHLSASNAPDYLLIIGKGLEPWYASFRRTDLNHLDLVPTGGYPGSDLVFSMGTGADADIPRVPTGRVPAQTAGEVAAYLNKVKEAEATGYGALWKKNILHLSGGIEQGEPELFRATLEKYAAIAEGPYLGGDVRAIAKQSTDLQLVDISEQVNQGVGLVTFFGHSSPTALDFDIGFATDPVLGYQNQGRYPMLFMNGCEAGAFFLHFRLFGEDWVLADKKGALGFLAHNSYALVPTLDQYATLFYEVAYGDSVFIKRGIGDIHAETVRRYTLATDNSMANRSQSQQVILLGDPAAKLFGARKADLAIEPSSVSVETFNGQRISVAADSFALRFIVHNMGIADPSPYRVEVSRTLPDGTVVTYDSLYELTYYSDTLEFIIRRGLENAAGNNVFGITLDADDIIAELSEGNNTASFTLFLPSNGTRNLFPNDFSIAAARDVELVFQATDVFSAERDYILEVDTVPAFSSAFRIHARVRGKVLLTYPTGLLDQDSLVYYWRTRIAEPLEGESAEWAASSFTYIDRGREGWSQVHFPQFSSGVANGIELVPSSRRMNFVTSVTPVSIVTFGAGANQSVRATSVKIKGSEYNLYWMENGGFGCRNNTFNLIAFNRSSTVPYPGVYLKWYEMLWTHQGRRLLCGREPFVINSFAWDEVSKNNNADLIAYVNNVEAGDSVVMYTTGNAGFDLWPPEARMKLSELGVSAAQLESFIAGEPIVIFGKKGGAPGTARVHRSDAPDQASARLEVAATVTGGFTAGTLKSPLVGPATAWEQASVRVREAAANDSYAVDVLGVAPTGTEVLLGTFSSGGYDLSGVDAAAYPYVRLRFHASDPVLLTPAQLDHWIITFVPAPEGIVVPFENREPLVLQEGESAVRTYGFINISDKDFAGPLTVRHNQFNALARRGDVRSFSLDAPLPGDTTFFTVPVISKGNAGLNDLEVFVNPRLVPERYFENNLIQLYDFVDVRKDVTTPVITVTFDGRRLRNGESVSRTPRIAIRVWDENRYLMKSDTVGVKITLRSPCASQDCPAHYISFRRDDVEWHPATETSDFIVTFSPAGLAPGLYVLRVEATDASQNAAAEPFEISFMIDESDGIVLEDPNPNPFSTDLHYGFELAGMMLPSRATFVVTDPAGREVYRRDVDSGSFHTGANEFSWNATAANGTRLVPGIYVVSFAVEYAGRVVRKSSKIVLR